MQAMKVLLYEHMTSRKKVTFCTVKTLIYILENERQNLNVLSNAVNKLWPEAQKSKHSSLFTSLHNIFFNYKEQ